MWRHLSSLTGKFAKDYPTLYRNRFQASPGNSDSADWPGYEVALHPLDSRHPVIKSKFCACAVTGLCFFSSLSLKLFKKNTRFREDKALSSLVVVNKHKFVHDRWTYEHDYVNWCILFQDSRSNAEEFPRSFLRGSLEGIWWAFVTMTTVG